MSEAGPYKRDGETVEVPGEEDRHEIADVEDDKPKHQQKEWLYRQYHIFGKSQREIAELAGVAQVTISKWMGKHDIPTRDRKLAVSLSKGGEADERLLDGGWLEEKYRDGHSSHEIARELGVSHTTVLDALKDTGIKIRGKSEAKKLAWENNEGGAIYNDPNWLYKQYWGKGRSIEEIADLAGCSEWPIRDKLQKHSIDIRSSKAGNLLATKKEKCDTQSDDTSENAVQKTDDGGVVLNYSWKTFEKEDDGCVLEYRNKNWLQERLDEGMTYSEIARACSGEVSRTTIHNWIGRHGIDHQYQSHKLNEEQVKEIRETYRDTDVSFQDLANGYGVSPGHISHIVNGDSWPDAPGPIKGEDYD